MKVVDPHVITYHSAGGKSKIMALSCLPFSSLQGILLAKYRGISGPLLRAPPLVVYSPYISYRLVFRESYCQRLGNNDTEFLE